MRRIGIALCIPVLFLSVRGAAAFVPSDDVQRHAVLVFCEGRKGSGVVTDGAGGYVVTAGHIVIDTTTGERAEDCTVRLPSGDGFTALTRYSAEVVHAIFDREHEIDFAMLRLGKYLSGPRVTVPAGLPADEDVVEGDDIAVLGYPENATDVRVTEGRVLGFERGMLISDAEISQGSSGGPAVDADGDLVGISTRIRFTVDEETGDQQVIDYGYGDIVALMTWLDTVDAVNDGHEAYVRHVDGSAYHDKPFFIRDSSAGCENLVRTETSSTVYCLRTGAQRASFPDVKTYASWFGDFDEVQYITPSNLADFALTGLVTHKAGTLVKVRTDPKVYLVTDNVGTLRWVPTEEMAATHFGEDWATKVVDVSDAFFPNYTIGAPLE